MSLLPLLLLFFPTWTGDARLPDKVELRDGTKLEGRVVFDGPADLVLLQGTRERVIARKDIESVFSRAANQREFLQRWRGIGISDHRQALDLAAWCRRVDLLENERLLSWWVLAGNPKNEEAHERLGHEQRDGKWTVRDGTHRWSWDDFVKRRVAWSDAWQLESSHFQVRTNLDLVSAVEAAFVLEGAYSAFYEQFQLDLRLYDVIVPMKAELHADKASFPEMIGHNLAYFDPLGKVLFVDASTSFEQGIVVHEATHQIFDSTAANTRVGRGAIPAWVDEGIAEYMRYALRGLSTKLEFDPQSCAMHHFQAHASAKPPIEIGRVLTLQTSDFQSSKGSDLKYAECYTLVHWSLHAHGGKYKNQFLDFLRSAYRGQSSSTEFKKSIGIDEREIDRDWLEYVRAIAKK